MSKYKLKISIETADALFVDMLRDYARMTRADLKSRKTHPEDRARSEQILEACQVLADYCGAKV